MSTVITDADMRTFVRFNLTDELATHDVDAIVREFIDTYGLIDLESIDTDEYWRIVARHAIF